MSGLDLIVRLLAPIAAGAIVAACASRPVTEGVTGVNSVHIAQAVRCEMRDFVIRLIVLGVAEEDKALALSLDRTKHRERPYQDEARIYGDFLKSGYKQIDNIDFTDLVPIYAETVVAYTFDFDIEQTNNVGVDIDFLSTLTRGTVSSALGASFNGKRQSKREFTLVDKLGDLLVNEPTIRICNSLRDQLSGPRQPNGVYPIAGSLNLGEIVNAFITLNQSGNLVDKVLDDNEINPTFSETLTFTTTITGGLKPTLKLEPLKSGTEIVGGVLDLKSTRTDIHKLTIAMNLPPQGNRTIAQKRSDKENSEFAQQQNAALKDIERQRIRDIEDENERLRRRLLGF